MRCSARLWKGGFKVIEEKAESLFSFPNVDAGDAVQALVQINMFLLTHMIGREMQRPGATILQTLKDNINAATLTDEARQIANAMIEACEISIKVFFDEVRRSAN
jgi:hypothetical protein